MRAETIGVVLVFLSLVLLFWVMTDSTHPQTNQHLNRVMQLELRVKQVEERLTTVEKACGLKRPYVLVVPDEKEGKDR